MSYIGRTITVGYCDGHFNSHNYGFQGSVVEGEGGDWVTIRHSNNTIYSTQFYNPEAKADALERWCSEANSEYEY